MFNTNTLLLWRLIHEYYGPDIEYNLGTNSIVEDELPRLINNNNQGTAYKSNYFTEIIPYYFDIEQLYEGTWSITIKYHRPMDKLKTGKYK